MAVYTTDGGNITPPAEHPTASQDGVRAEISAMAASIGAMTKAIGQLAHSTAGAVEESRTSAKASAEALTEAVKGMATKGRKIKASQIIDPADDTEVTPASTSDMDQYVKNYREVKHGPPMANHEPTEEQMGAFFLRVIILLLAPYADFSLFTPFGRRMQRALRHRGWILNEDGTYSPVEVPGPASFDIWWACWRVYATALLMLRWPVSVARSTAEQLMVVSPQALEVYFDRFRQLVREYPECWFLCCKAEDRCRGEHFMRLRRARVAKGEVDPSWSDIMIEAAMDNEFWDREVRRPAIRFVAKGCKGTPAEPDEEHDVHKIMGSGSTGSAGSGGGKGEGGRGTKRVRQQLENVRNELNRMRSQLKGGAPPQGNYQPKGGKAAGGRGAGSGKGGYAPNHGPPLKKDNRGRYVTNENGLQICYAYHNSGCGINCHHGRAHQCQFCLKSHQNQQCTDNNKRQKQE